jgi:H+/gluconate symporter-like permease
LKTTRKVFLALFILSTLGALVLFVFSSSLMFLSASATQEPGVAPTPSTGDPGTVEPAPQNSVDLGFTALMGSIITSVTSLVGFIVTTAVTWRKEKREASLADVERRKLEVELEKSRLELEEMKKAAERKEKDHE